MLKSIQHQSAVSEDELESKAETATGNAESSIEAEISALLRESSWDARKKLGYEIGMMSPRWSRALRFAVGHALREARAGHVRHAHGVHLLVGILEDPRNEACMTLLRLGVDRASLLGRLPIRESVCAEGRPLTVAADFLAFLGVLDVPRHPLLRRLGHNVGAVAIRSRVGVVIPILEQEAIRQAVRAGSSRVGKWYLLVAICALEEQLLDKQRRFADPWAGHNTGGQILRGWGIDTAAVTAYVARLPEVGSLSDRGRRWRGLRTDPPFGIDAAQMVDGAKQIAVSLGHRAVGTTHLLLAMLSEEEGEPSHPLVGLGVDTRALRNQVQREFGMGGGAVPA